MSYSHYPPAEGRGPVNGPEEIMAAIDLLDILHNIHKAALKRNVTDVEASVSIGEPTDIMESEFFVIEQPGGDNSVPCGYDRMILKPREVSISVEGITLKVPRLTALESEIFVLPDGAKRWNDIILEVKYPDSQIGRYLYNSRGIVPFPDAEALGDASMLERATINADLFYVPDEYVDWMVPPLQATWLEDVLETCEMQRQNNSVE